jgi:hypothetical protein
MPSPFVGEIFTFRNLDDSEVTLRGWGNQFEAVFETLDGYTVVQAQDGFYEYAKLTDDGTALVASGIRIDAEDPQTLSLPKHLRVTRQASRSHADEARRAMKHGVPWDMFPGGCSDGRKIRTSETCVHLGD